MLCMKVVKYTRHAKNRMRLHRITEAEIESAIGNPDFIEPSSEKFLVITAVKKKKGWR